MSRFFMIILIAGVILWTGLAVFNTTRQETLTQQIKVNQGVIIDRLMALSTQATARPQAHTACDTVKILKDLRAQGIPLPHYEVEDRCP